MDVVPGRRKPYSRAGMVLPVAMMARRAVIPPMEEDRLSR